jgi:hypothetical protein
VKLFFETELVAAFMMMMTLMAATVSCAQVVPAATGPEAYVAVGAGLSAFQSVYGQRDIAGGVIFADVHPEGRFGLEGEARFLRYHTFEDVNETNYIGGIRFVVFDVRHVEPYVKFLAGMGKITLPFGDAHGSFLDYAPGAGLDLALNHSVTLRMIDFEYQHWPQFTFGSFSPYGISSGIRVRMTPIAWIPHVVRKRRVPISRAARRAEEAME